MATIRVKPGTVDDVDAVIALCPFRAIEFSGAFTINAGCKMCGLCVKQRPDLFEMTVDKVAAIDKSQWRGIAVYVEHQDGDIHPVTLELIGKARSMADKIGHPVYAVFIGQGVHAKAQSLLAYGVDEVSVYDEAELKHFRIEPYAAALEAFLLEKKPSIVLVGGTTTGRSLAPRLAARFRSGLTADCTVLDVQENTDLDQIRPAFGGNIMAHIHTPNHRPQFATVRYKIFDHPQPVDSPKGTVVRRSLEKDRLASRINVLQVRGKDRVPGIEDAELVVAAGRGIRKQADLEMVHRLAELLGAEVAGTRPLIEAGWIDPRRQIGLSGRTVKPKLLIACGVSGAVQFAAGMQNADRIIAINQDRNAPILKIAHYGMVGDLYDILPGLCDKIAAARTSGDV